MALRIILNKSCIQFQKYYVQQIIVNSYCNKSNITEIKKKESKDASKKKEEASKKLNYLLQSIIKDDNPKNEKAAFSKPKSKSKPKKQMKSEEKNIDETKIIEAAEVAAKSLGGNVEKTKSELISKLLSYSDEKKVDTTNMSQLISNMKVESQATPSRSEQTRQILKSKPQIKQRTTRSTVSQAERLDLFGGEQLNIFSKPDTPTENITLKTWNHLQNRELRLAVTHPPSNYYQQMILWTEQGKLWKFPIDNEQGLEDEQNVYFADHVFLEPLLDDWCPRQGPIRHFMELVCVGLSKNHFLTATEKHAHIDWFKNYFSEKIDLLKEVGAVPTNHTIQPEQNV